MAKTVGEQMAIINNLHKRHEAIYRDYASKMGFAEMSFWVLYAICCYKRPITQYELVRDWGYSKQTVNSATLKLISEGYIASTDAGTKRRKKMLELTESGEKFAEGVVYPMIFAERASLNFLSVEERDFFIDVYTKQMDFLERAIAPVMNKK
ncbi:MAG: MarR family transcriptional regulator [Lachnospiraceae bacterium]|nr:MarR family transcriptional regulator [Lachnospiraceae bacterium]